MAEQKKYKFILEIDDKGSISKLKSTEKGIKDLDFTSKKAQNSLKSLNAHIKSMGGSANIKSIKLTSKELKDLSNKMGGVSQATGASTAAAMEFGRVLSDAPFAMSISSSPTFQSPRLNNSNVVFMKLILFI